MIFALAWKELRHSWRQLLTVFAILFLGFLGPLIATSLRSSTNFYLRGQARDLLSADLSMVSSRPFERSEIETAEDELKPLKVERETDLMTMATAAATKSSAAEKGQSALISVHGVSSDFPIYNRFRVKTSDSGEADFRSPAELQSQPIAWAYRDVFIQLGIKIGDSVRLGKKDFKIVGELVEGPGSIRAGFSFAPMIYIGFPFIESTGLISMGSGSQISHRVFFKLLESTDLSIAGERLKKRLPDPEIYLRTPDDSIRGIERFMEFFGQYLGVVTLIVFSLSWVSAFYIIEIFLMDRLRPSAVLLMVGGSRVFVGLLQTLQIFFVSLISLGTAALLLETILVLARPLIEKQLPAGFELAVHGSDLLSLGLMCVVSSVAFAIPFLAKLARLNPNLLLSENSLGANTGKSSLWLSLFSYAPLVVVFFLVSIWLLDSVLRGTLVLATLAATIGVGWLISRVLFRFFFTLLKRRQGLLRLVATNLSRGRFGTDLCFIALTLVALILNLVPHLLNSAVSELKPESAKDRPALFLFNIPESGVDAVSESIRKQGGELRYLSPMILARLEKVNGAAPRDESVQRFPVRMTYREKLASSERITSGEAFAGHFDERNQKYPDVSLETQFAERKGLKIGDILTFDLQGLPIEAKVKNLRRVRWTDFHPNFFIEFQTGVLEDAPKTYIANVGGISGEKKAQMQFQLIRNFPDLSVIDVGASIDKILGIVDSMLKPIRLIAAIAVGMSVLILLLVISHNLRLRQGELEVLKVLGAKTKFIRRLIVSEYLTTGVFAAVVGSSFAVLVAIFVTRSIFDVATRVSWSGLAWSYLVVILSSILISSWAVARRLSRSSFLRSE